MDLVDSNKHKLNIAQIVGVALHHGINDEVNLPPKIAMTAILSELSQPNVKTKVIGNTLFEVIEGQDGQGFFKAFNADTGDNFVENSKKFCVWARHVLNMKVLVTEFGGQEIMQLFKIIAMHPPMPGMGYQVFHMQSGKTRIVLKLGD